MCIEEKRKKEIKMFGRSSESNSKINMSERNRKSTNYALKHIWYFCYIFYYFSNEKKKCFTWLKHDLKPHSGLSCSDILTYLKYLLYVYISLFTLFCFSLLSTDWIFMNSRIKGKRLKEEAEKLQTVLLSSGIKLKEILRPRTDLDVGI